MGQDELRGEPTLRPELWPKVMLPEVTEMARTLSGAL
jgi:hypothetical protein